MAAGGSFFALSVCNMSDCPVIVWRGTARIGPPRRSGLVGEPEQLLVPFGILKTRLDMRSFPSTNWLRCRLPVNCGWSSWSDWGECLGPCGVQSVQWSFRSPNNPSKHGEGKTCRGIYRKARRCADPRCLHGEDVPIVKGFHACVHRHGVHVELKGRAVILVRSYCRCQTEPCEECRFQGRSHPVGDRWASDRCHLCSCLDDLSVQCSPFCPQAARGCPPVRTTVPRLRSGPRPHTEE